MVQKAEDSDMKSLSMYDVHPISDSPRNPPVISRCCHLLLQFWRILIYRCCHLVCHFWHMLIYRWWWWEIASLIISANAMAVVIWILCKINGLAVDQWTFPIQANSMVSVFLTISKSALLVPVAECISQAKWMQFSKKPLKLSGIQAYDDASRGPLGAAVLLVRKTGWIAWLGAFLTVISLALDPFVQQIIELPSRTVALPSGRAEISATRSIKKIDRPAMHGAILSAIYSPTEDPSSPLTYTCSTSSCFWNHTITSVGVCSFCHNVTSSFRPQCTTRPGPLYPNPGQPGQAWSQATTTCNYTINAAANITFPAFIQTMTYPGTNERPTEYANQYTQLQINSQHGLGGERGREPLALSGLLDPKIRWVATAVTYTTSYDKYTRRMPKVTIKELAPEINLCGLYLCAQTYDHSLAVVNGSFVSTKPTSTVPLGDIISPADGRAEYVPIEGGQEAEVLAPLFESTVINYGNLSSESSSPAENSNENPSSSDKNNKTTPSIQGSRFTISQQAIFDLQGHLHNNVLNISQSSGNIDFGSAFPIPNYGADVSALIASQTSSKNGHSSRSDAAFVNVSATFDRIARGITARLWVENGSRLIKGDALHDETFFRVAWCWVILPVGVVMLAVGLLAGTIWATTSCWNASKAGLGTLIRINVSKKKRDHISDEGETSPGDLSIHAKGNEDSKGDATTTVDKMDDKSPAAAEVEVIAARGNERVVGNRKPGIWKGSSLALLISSLEMPGAGGKANQSSLQDELSQIQNLEDLERFADAKTVRLMDADLADADAGSKGRRFVIVENV